MEKRFDRTDEAGFRALVPRNVAQFTVLEVGGFSPGRPGFYASAFALLKVSNGYSTHRLICADDRPDAQLSWYLTSGHCFTEPGDDMGNRKRAEADFVQRAYGSVFCLTDTVVPKPKDD